MIPRTEMVFAAFAAFSLWSPGVAQDKSADQSRPGLVVVAPKSFHAALREFTTHKQKRIPTRLVALEEILKVEKGADDPEKLKRFLYSAWKKGEAGYALLVGDVDIMPVRYMVLDRATPAAFDYAFYPSDLYYADVAKSDGTFDDWNGNKEGFHARYFGEVRGEKNKQDPINYDGISYVPELGVGRWPVSTPAEVAIVAAKTIRYEVGFESKQKVGAQKVGLFAVGGWVDSRGLMGHAADTLGKRLEVERFFYGGNGPQPTEKELYRCLNDGAGLLLHAGHGDTHRWEQCCSTRGLAGVKNADRLPVMFSAGCSTAYFATLPPYEPYLDADGKDHKGTNAGEIFTEPPPPPSPYQKGKYNTTGLGEYVLKHGPDGAVAYIGCNTGSQPCGLTLVEGFCQHLAANENARLGDCWKAAVSHYHEKEKLATIKPTNDWYPASIFFQGMKFMVFGDPSIRLP